MEVRDIVEQNNTELFCFLDVDEERLSELSELIERDEYITNIPDTSGQHVSIPDAFKSTESRVQFVISIALNRELVEESEEIFIVFRPPQFEDSISILSTTVTDDNVRSSIDRLFIRSAPQVNTVKDTLRVALSLARTGQKGEPVGALFVVGDSASVMEVSSELNFNPFTGEDACISDDVVSAALGEFSKLDGAFIINNNGRIVSANRYLEPKAEEANVPSGLGARHMAAGGITVDTEAVSIVVSESDQKVRCFVDGELVLELDPEEYTKTLIY